MVDVNTLSNNDLHKKLIELGVINCPVTASTRKFLLKKYGREIVFQSKTKVSKSRNNRKSQVQLGFSSDEEGFENSLNRTPPNHKFRRKSVVNDASSKSSRRSSSFVNSDFKKPSSLPRKSTRRSLISESENSLASPSSDEDFGVSLHRRTRSSNPGNMIYAMDISDSENEFHLNHSAKKLNKPFLSDRQNSKTNKLNSSRSDVHNDVYRSNSKGLVKTDTDSLNGSKIFNLQNHDKITPFEHESVQEPRVNEITDATTNVNDHYDHFYSNKQEKVRDFFASCGRSNNLPRNHHHPHTISTFLLAVAVVFFIAIGFFYVVGIQQWNLSDIYNNHLFFSSNINPGYFTGVPNLGQIEGICHTKDCVHPDRAKLTLKFGRALIQELGIIAGKYDCEEAVTSKNMTRHKAMEFLKTLDMENDNRGPEEILSDVLKLFLRNKEKWAIRLFDNEMDDKLYFPHQVRWLESNIPLKSFVCRFKFSLFSVLWKIFSVFCIIFISLCGYKLYVFHRLKQEEERNKVFDLAEEIIGIIKKYHMQLKVMERLDEECYIPVTHVRDMLIPLVDRAKMMKVWEDACKIIEDNESRVRVEYQTIAGEENKVWRWLENTLNGESNSKVWQGRAFEEDISGVNALSYFGTSCLKIRNMFSPDKEKENGWETPVIDAVIEKSGDNHQIVHIAIANDSSIPEGCVYVKCKDKSAAGQVYKFLHGWWYDGKLVTVKFLKLERYHEHYPEAIDLTTPLKPSNNLKLSLSHDSQFSSNEVLERS